MIFSKRTNWSLQSNPLIEFQQGVKRQHADYIDLTLSNLTSCGLKGLNEDLLNAFINPKSLQYDPQAQGSLIARQAIVKYYARRGFKVNVDNIFLTSSTSEGYSYLFRLLGNPQDRILFPQPSYPLFQYLVDLNDLKMDFYPLHYVDRWQLDIQTLAAQIDPETKAVAVVNPNNPTGSYIKEEEYWPLVEVCKKHQLAIIADEVFWDYQLHEAKTPLSFVDRHDVLTFTLSGISKILGLPQMKLSWIVLNGPTALVAEAKERLEIIADTYLSVSTPIQMALTAWLEQEEPIQQEVKGRLVENLKFLKENIKRSPMIECLTVEGGWYAVLKLPIKFSDDEWTMKFLKEDHVFVHPGYFYDFIDDSHVVISLLPVIEQFQSAISRILKRVSAS